MNRSKRNYDLTQRAIVNGISIIALAFFIFISGYPSFRWIFACGVAAIAAIALWEYYQFVKKKEISPAVSLGITAVVLYVIAVFFKTQQPELWRTIWQNAPEIILAVAFLACFVFFTYAGKPPIIHIATTFLGILYIGIPLGLVVRIMYFNGLFLEGSWWIIYLIAVTKGSDTGGYFVGRRFGKRKLASKLSPNKTLEGALGGLCTAIAMSLFICFLGKQVGFFKAFTYFEAVWLGAAMGILGQIGDLAESLLKRDAAIKDSNRIPGVGGILDMIDSILFTAPVLYVFLKWTL